MVKKSESPLLLDDLQKQRAYVERQKARHKQGLGIVFADAFLRGIRDLGYKSPATALNELVDNSIQAGATLVDVVFGFRGKGETKPDLIAVVDNGHGMSPEMIRYAVAWGGTHRENDRIGFGRYGYGLPSSAVSLAKRYTVYSKEPGGKWHALTIDLDELAERAGSGGEAAIPDCRPAELPAFLRDHEIVDRTKRHAVARFASGTAVVLETLDRLPSGWVQTNILSDKLKKQLGVVYRHLIPCARLFVHGQPVDPVDPLFLMENGRLYRETAVMAQAVPTASFEVKVKEDALGRVRLRASLLPADFHLAATNDSSPSAKNHRYPIMQDYNGLLVCRSGRQVDCLGVTPWTRFQNNDAHVKIEIDFDPILDEFFGITTSKQSVTIAEAMWSRLEAAGLRKLIADLRKEYEKSSSAVEAAGTGRDVPRPSEQAMREADRLKPRRIPISPGKAASALKNLHDEAVSIAEQTGSPLEQVLEAKQLETAGRPFKADFRAIPEGPFYRCERLGAQKRLIINTHHSFYANIYNAPDATPEIQSALEVLLFVLADGELDAEGEFEEFYRSARMSWSIRLTDALKKLDPENKLSDKVAALAEALAMKRGEGLLDNPAG